MYGTTLGKLASRRRQQDVASGLSRYRRADTLTVQLVFPNGTVVEGLLDEVVEFGHDFGEQLRLKAARRAEDRERGKGRTVYRYEPLVD